MTPEIGVVVSFQQLACGVAVSAYPEDTSFKVILIMSTSRVTRTGITLGLLLLSRSTLAETFEVPAGAYLQDWINLA